MIAGIAKLILAAYTLGMRTFWSRIILPSIFVILVVIMIGSFGLLYQQQRYYSGIKTQRTAILNKYLERYPNRVDMFANHYDASRLSQEDQAILAQYHREQIQAYTSAVIPWPYRSVHTLLASFLYSVGRSDTV